MGEANFSNRLEDLDYLIILRPDRKERVHIYRRPDGSFGRRNFVWYASEYGEGWTLGTDWGHFYDSMSIAFNEACGDFPWIVESLKPPA